MSLTTSAPASTSTCELIGPNTDIAAPIHNATEISYFCEWIWPTHLDAAASCCTGNKKVSTLEGGCHHWCLVKDEDNNNELDKFFSCLAGVEQGATGNRGCMLVGPRRTRIGQGAGSTSTATTATSSATIRVTMSTSASGTATGTPAGGNGTAPGGAAKPTTTSPPGNAGVSSKSMTIGSVLVSALALTAFLI